MEIKINRLRAEMVFGQLLAALRRKEFPYDQVLPQHLIPAEIKNNKLAHARFLFYVCHYMRGTVRSDFAVQQLVEMWRSQPEHFDPETAAKQCSEKFIGELPSLLQYRAKEIARFWVENSRRLAEHWGSDPRLIFKDISTREGMYRRIMNKVVPKLKWDRAHEAHEAGFLGFQQKMSHMLAYFLMEAGLIDPLPISPAVDFHVLRVLIATEIISIDMDPEKEVVRYEHLFPYGIEACETYIKSHGVSTVELGDAIWLISTTLCRRAPGNSMVGRNKKKGELRKRPTPFQPDWANAAHIKRYLGSCGSCPANDVCSTYVFSGAYYEAGRFGLRPREHVPLLFQRLPWQRTDRRASASISRQEEEKTQLSLFSEEEKT